MTFPFVDREPVRLPTLAGHDDELWDTLIELSDVRPGEWTLIGGQMVFLHGIEHGATPPRISTDLDVVVNARIAGRPVAAFAAGLEDLGFEQDGISPDGIAHRYRRNRVTIDVLAPEGLGERTDLTTTPPGRTLQVPGGTQALERTELVPVATATRSGHVPRPSLLGAVVGKAMAVAVDDAPNAQRLDFVFLLSLIDDPFDLADRLTTKDRQRLRARKELIEGEHRVWNELDTDARDRARTALRILTR
ncbi:MAG: hypothetical protein ACJAR2_001321 [Ilumatobacter sp.]